MTWAQLGAAAHQYAADLLFDHFVEDLRRQGPARGQWTKWERVVEATDAWVEARDDQSRREAAYLVGVNRRLGRGP